MQAGEQNFQEERKYFSLREAAKLCQYSQEYLSLRARQGKLKAVKIGRNWVTTKEWLKNYIEKVEDYYKNLEKGKKRKIEVKAIKSLRNSGPPNNLPTGRIAQWPKLNLSFILKMLIFLVFLFSLIILFLKNINGIMKLFQSFLSEITQKLLFVLDKNFQQIEIIGLKLTETKEKIMRGVIRSAQKAHCFFLNFALNLKEGNNLLTQELEKEIEEKTFILSFFFSREVWQENLILVREYQRYLASLIQKPKINFDFFKITLEGTLKILANIAEIFREVF